MSFRARLTLVAAAAVAVAVVLASVLAYFVVRDQLREQLDDGLRERAAEIQRLPPDRVERAFFGHGPPLGGAEGYPQAVFDDGRPPLLPEGETVALPIDERTREMARGEGGDVYLRDARVDGVAVRIIAIPYGPGPGVAIQVARPLDEVNDTVARVRTYLLVIGAAGTAIAALLGLVIAGAALAPIRRLTAAAESVTTTGDLSQRIEVRGRDELSRLAERFNTMLAALEESSRAQRQLVADASHELRTPLTSLRTNIEVLATGRPLPEGERERLLADVVEQLEEMTSLVGELIELARGEQLADEPEDVRLDELVASAVERTRRNRPAVNFRTDFQDAPLRGSAASIERAIGNLLDNAAKWTPPGREVEVSVRPHEVRVRDHGPGIAAEDLPYIFDRFYRAKAARGMPGSGLGLAIVRQVAQAHGGCVEAAAAEGGGTVMTLRLPGVAWNGQGPTLNDSSGSS